jgi:phage terminase small subunit
MAALSNPRWERFCQELVDDDNQTQAYIRAGYPGRGANRSARRRLDRPEVAARVAELRTLRNERICKQAGVTEAWLFDSALELYARAAGKGTLSTMQRTLGRLGKLAGVWPRGR